MNYLSLISYAGHEIEDKETGALKEWIPDIYDEEEHQVIDQCLINCYEKQMSENDNIRKVFEAAIIPTDASYAEELWDLFDVLYTSPTYGEVRWIPFYKYHYKIIELYHIHSDASTAEKVETEKGSKDSSALTLFSEAFYSINMECAATTILVKVQR